MEAVLRRLKLKKGEPQDTEARKQLQQDLFAFGQVSWFGYYILLPTRTAIFFDVCCFLEM